MHMTYDRARIEKADPKITNYTVLFLQIFNFKFQISNKSALKLELLRTSDSLSAHPRSRSPDAREELPKLSASYSSW